MFDFSFIFAKRMSQFKFSSVVKTCYLIFSEISCVKVGMPKLCKYLHILWHIDPLLGKDLETKKDTTAIAMQQRGKHTSTTIEILLGTVLCNLLLGSCNSWTTTMEMEVFSMWSVPRSYLEDNWGDRVS
jgi:hypothetical protein